MGQKLTMLKVLNDRELEVGRFLIKDGENLVGILTDDAITRTSYYVPAVILALILFKKPGLTWG